MNNIALFSGSFNPVHIGHLAIANYALSFSDIDELWFVVSPQNPLKKPSEIAEFKHRLKMAQIAVENSKIPIVVSDIEDALTKPSYTINTLEHLKKMRPDCHFSLLIGADNLAGFERWKDWKTILNNHRLLVYPRLGFDALKLCQQYNATEINAPIIEVSSTFIRNSLNENINVNAFLPYGVIDYINQNKLYK